MKFRALFEISKFKTFVTVVQSMTKLSEEATLILNRDGLQLHCEAGANHPLKCFAQLDPSDLWSSFIIESRANNVIGLKFDLGTLMHALRGGNGAHSVSMKLTKKGQTKYLSLAMEVMQDVGLVINHEVPVRVLAESQLPEYKEPELPSPLASAALPDVRRLKTLVERLKTFSPHEVSFEIRPDGTLCVCIETTDTAIKAYYPDMADQCKCTKSDRKLGFRYTRSPAYAVSGNQEKKVSVSCNALKKAVDAFSLQNRHMEVLAGKNSVDNSRHPPLIYTTIYCPSSTGMCPPVAFVINCGLDTAGSISVLLPLKQTEEY
eukprot:gb/GECG01015436.1/.p1 GENE.gb/GECG01015436.1/~~gb/GECG01015436.1/.p1  ORF type:complete len:319 (+),score=25.73 gb/GECG01015436.1/:1-957(+)